MVAITPISCETINSQLHHSPPLFPSSLSLSPSEILVLDLASPLVARPRCPQTPFQTLMSSGSRLVSSGNHRHYSHHHPNRSHHIPHHHHYHLDEPWIEDVLLRLPRAVLRTPAFPLDQVLREAISFDVTFHRELFYLFSPAL